MKEKDEVRWKEWTVGVKGSFAALWEGSATGLFGSDFSFVFSKCQIADGLVQGQHNNNVSTPSCCLIQSSTLRQNRLVIKSRSSPDVTLDDYRLINYHVPPSPSFMTEADVSTGLSLYPAVKLHHLFFYILNILLLNAVFFSKDNRAHVTIKWMQTNENHHLMKFLK